MTTLFDQIIIYLLCASFWFSKSVSFATVTLFLSVLLCGNLISLSNSSKFCFGLFGGFVALSFALPDLFYFYPFIIYEIEGKTTQKKYIFVLMSFCELLHLYLFPVSLWLYSLLLFGLAFQLQNTTEKKDYWKQKYRQTRNENYEHSYDLMEKNKALRQNQDYEIHLATLKERNRIAREIHDNVGHLLSRSLLQTGALQVMNHDTSLDVPLRTLKDSLDTAMTSIRNSVHDLHDESIHLQTALSDLQKEASDLTVSLHYKMQTEPPKEFKYAILAITKEALTNTRRHSNAERFDIHLTEHPAFYQLILKDNGTMISKDFSGGIGLENMRERVKQLGGEFHIVTTDGFRIQIILWKGETS
ncbi:putative histidine kinase-related ATPase [Roseburia sp. CAG:309]|nr:putative histidine kinase-related ATPase [Roseburia sp. CAG:309]